MTTDPDSPVAHDTEVMALASQSGRLFAASDQWEYPGSGAAGQILVKDSASAPWRVFEQTQSLRVQAIDSFAIPADQGMGAGHSLLITQVIVGGHSRIQWLIDGAKAFTPANSFVLPSAAAGVRSFGAHEADGIWAVYAGVSPTGLLRGVWSQAKHTLIFGPAPEVTSLPPASRGLKTQKVTGFADCGGALYATINTRLYRRNDSGLSADAPRWALVYQEPPVGAFNSGLRGLSCVTHQGSPALLVSTEGTGNVYRFDDLSDDDAVSGIGPGDGNPLVPVLEFNAQQALHSALARSGTVIPQQGNGSINYVIAAYNDFENVTIDGVARQFFGIEHAYLETCPSNRICGPTAFGAEKFDAAACFAVRTDAGKSPSYVLRCLDGKDFTPSGTVTRPIRTGQAFVSIRTVKASPFDASRIYLAGYDCNFYPADGTAWIGQMSRAGLEFR